MASTYKVRTISRTRTLTSGTKYAHKSYEVLYTTPDGVWHIFPDIFSDRDLAIRTAKAVEARVRVAATDTCALSMIVAPVAR